MTRWGEIVMWLLDRGHLDALHWLTTHNHADNDRALIRRCDARGNRWVEVW